ncbi:lipid A deacylase LpxR family protein [Flavobacterium sp.]|uniref:lipid A deacylase LpxR family protein n=1 Tax=Flavobacterium sp. TaxID=239 RepID=UPI0025D0DBBA|nr:lipid A deacylase LpxR family protein [Flavobacterium sp.]
MKKSRLFPFLLLLFAFSLSAQKIDNTASFRDLKSPRYFRFNYDNDYFASEDKDYTQGYNFELASPGIRHNPINNLLLKPFHSEIQYGISIEHIGFTPNNIKSPDIQFGDRPFAASIMLKSFAVATDTLHNSRLVSVLNIGLIGPGAFGKEMQVAIHRATGNTIPEGWQNQIKNDIVLNYELSYEKQVVRYRNLFSLQTNSTLRLGTLFTNASLGFNTTFGFINSPFKLLKAKKRVALYGYAQPLLNVIGYDATLQGGLFNHKSPYTIADSDVERFTAQLNYGLVLQTRTLYFEYSRVTITKEFATGANSKWGGIKMGFLF